jgi:hypothetical protein
VAGQLDDLPAGEVLEDLGLELLRLALQLDDLVAEVDPGAAGELLQLLDLRLEGDEGLLELCRERDAGGHGPAL